MKKKEPRNNVFRMIPLLLNDNILCLKFFAYGSTEHHTLFLLYFYGSVCLTHTLLLLLCVCMCVCVCVHARAHVPNIYTQCHISMVVKTHELPVLSKYCLVF